MYQKLKTKCTKIIFSTDLILIQNSGYLMSSRYSSFYSHINVVCCLYLMPVKL